MSNLEDGKRLDDRNERANSDVSSAQSLSGLSDEGRREVVVLGRRGGRSDGLEGVEVREDLIGGEGGRGGDGFRGGGWGDDVGEEEEEDGSPSGGGGEVVEDEVDLGGGELGYIEKSREKKGRGDQRSVLGEKEKGSTKGTERLTGLDLLLSSRLGVSVDLLAL